MDFYSVIMDFFWVSVILFVAKIIREHVKILQNFFIPVSLIAGFIAWVVGPYGLKIVPLTSLCGDYAGALITVLFATIGLQGLGIKKGEGKKRAKDIAGYCVYRQINWAVQFSVPMILSILLLSRLHTGGDLHPAFGWLIPVSFLGGTGPAIAAGQVLDKYGFSDFTGLGITAAAYGMLLGLIGGIIMTHGDNNGLVLPPRIAPIQAMVIPVAQHKEGVLEAASALLDRLKAAGIRARMDSSDQSMGWKAAEYEMKGVPLRVEIGPKDMEKNQCVLVRRDSGEKVFISLDELETAVPATLDAIHDGLYQRAKKNLEEHIFEAHSLEEAKALQAQHGGFIKTMWCGELACELKMKEEAGMTSRCIPFAQEHLGDTCPICGRAAKKMIYWGVAY